MGSPEKQELAWLNSADCPGWARSQMRKEKAPFGGAPRGIANDCKYKVDLILINVFM